MLHIDQASAIHPGLTQLVTPRSSLITDGRTLRRPVTLTGIGLHSGKPATVRILPRTDAPGIEFHRVDLRDAEPIPAASRWAASTGWCTKLQCGDAVVQTPEHLLASLFAFGVTAATVEIDGPELPILDGSAAPYAEALLEAGFQPAAMARADLAVTRPHWVDHEDAHILVRPAAEFLVTYLVDYGRPLAPKQCYEGCPLGETFARDIAPARTFALAEWIPALQEQGLAAGGSVDNAVVVFADRLSTELRFPDEFVRHKVLDLLGDLALLGRPLRGHVVAIKSSHTLNARLVAELEQTEIDCLPGASSAVEAGERNS